MQDYSHREMRAEQTRLLFKGVNYSVVGNLVVGLLMAIILSDKVPDPAILWIWFGVLSAATSLRIVAWFSFSKVSSEEKQKPFWLWLFAFLAWMSAILWGISPWLFYPTGYPEYQVMMLFALVGIAGGAIAVLAYHFTVLLVYELLMFAGIVGYLFVQGDALSLQLVFLVTLYFGFILRGGHRVGSIVLEGLQLRLTAESSQRSLQRARDGALAANRIKGEVLATMSHEVRTPLNGVLGMTELLLDTPLDERQRHLVDSARRSSESLLEVVNHVLDFSRIESGKLDLQEELFDLRQLLEDVLDMVTSGCRNKQLRVTANLADSLPDQVWGDPVRLRQVLVNLLGNAVKFTERGKVTLSVDVVWESDQEAAIRFAVTDTGPGIPIERQDTIFHPFEQAEGESTARSFGGAGLGLSIVRELLQLMHSEIELESEPGKGSRFSFILRLRPQQRFAHPLIPEQLADTAMAENERLQGLRVLLAEDSQVNREVTLAMLANLGVEVDAVDNGRAAVEAVSGTCYHLLLIDCQMPGMDGYTAAEMIRKREQKNKQQRLPIVATTGDVTQGVQERCKVSGMDAYITKPFDTEKLRRKILQWADPERCQQSKPAPVLNPAALAKLRENDKGLLHKAVTLYLWDAPEQLRATSEAVAAGHLQESARVLRSLKSASAFLGAEKLADLCAQMEDLARQGEADRLEKLLLELEQQFSQVTAALRQQ
ncbi:ATP-binding protein [Thiolapillus sp.]